MKLALVVPGGVDRSGEYRVIPALLALIKRLSRTHEVHVFALRQESAPGGWELAGAQIHNIGDRFTRWRAIQAIRTEHGRAPFDIVHAIWSGWGGFIAVMAALILHVPSLVHIAGGELIGLRDIRYGGRQNWKGRLREALVLRAATAITAPSAPILDSLRRLGLAAQRVPLGVDLEVWRPRLPRRRDPGVRARLIHIASLNPVKDQPTLLRALAAVARSGLRFEMDIVGEDTLHGQMQIMARDLGLSRSVRFHGFQTQHDLQAILDSAHLLVMTSRHEAGPVALLEAAVAGVPTVGTAVGHIAEWSPLAALAAPIGDWLRLSEKISELLNDDDLRLRVAAEAWRWATVEDADHTAKRFQEIYVELVHGRH